MMGGIERIGTSVKFISGLALIWGLVLFWRPMISNAEVVDRIVAIVNEDAITLSEIDEAIGPFVRQIQGAAYGPDEKRQLLFKIRQDMLNRMIDQKLTEQESQRLGVSVQDLTAEQSLLLMLLQVTAMKVQ